MVSTVSIRKIIPQILLRKLSSIIPDFHKADDDQIIMFVYEWGNDSQNYFYPPSSDFANMQMCIQMKSFVLRNKSKINVGDALSVIIEAFEVYNNPKNRDPQSS